MVAEQEHGAPGTAPALLGVLGGMGPLATIDFMHKLLQATPARRDQDHVPVLVSSIPQIPDRNAAFTGTGESPLAAMVDCATRLKQAGAGLLVMPCNTAHLWFDALQAAVGLPMLHIVDAAIAEARGRLAAGTGKNAPPVPLGLLATHATQASGLYTRHASVHWLLPTEDEMQQLVMPGIHAIKSNQLDTGRHLLQRAAQRLHQRGAQALVLGCTEVPLVLDEGNTPMPVVDATAALARAAVAWSMRGVGLADKASKTLTMCIM